MLKAFYHFTEQVDFKISFGLKGLNAHTLVLYVHLIVVTQAQVLCLICTPEALGLRVYISGRAFVCVLQLLNVSCVAQNPGRLLPKNIVADWLLWTANQLGSQI